MPSCEHFISIFNASPLPSLLLLPDAPRFTITNANTAWLKITGAEIADLPGKGIFEAFPGNLTNLQVDGAKNLGLSLHKSLETKQPHKMALQQYNIPISGSTGFKERYYDVENIPVLDDNGDIITIIHTLVDITEYALQQKEILKLEGYASEINRINSNQETLINGTNDLAWSQAVEKTKDELNTILESIGDAFFAVDKNWVVTYWNSQAEKVLYTPKSNILGHNLWEVFSDSIDSESYKKYHESLETKQSVHFEDYYKPLDKWYEISAYPSGTGLSVYFRDITERKIAEIKQKEAAVQQSLFVSIVNSSDDAIISKTLGGIITSWNHGAEKLFGYSEKEAIGKHISIIIPARLIHEEDGIVETARNGGYIKHHETERLRKDATLINVSLTVSPVIDTSGNIIGVSKIARDITEKKKAAEAIRLSNERYNIVAKATNDSIWDWNIITGKVIRTGDGFANLFGYSAEQANNGSFSWSALIHAEDLQRVQEFQGRILNDPGKLYWEDEYRFLKANGQYAYVSGKGYIIRDNNGTAIRMIGATQDITQQKEQINEITRIQQNLDSLINNTKDRVWSINTAFKIITANKAYSDFVLSFTGNPAVEGSNAILAVFDESIIEKWTGLYQRALSGESFSVDETVANPATGELSYTSISFSPIIGKEGNVTGVACFAKDITERVKYIETVEKQNVKLREIAWIQSHVVRAPLARMMGIVNLIKDLKVTSPEGEELLNHFIDSGKEFDIIIKDIVDRSNHINI